MVKMKLHNNKKIINLIPWMLKLKKNRNNPMKLPKMRMNKLLCNLWTLCYRTNKGDSNNKCNSLLNNNKYSLISKENNTPIESHLLNFCRKSQIDRCSWISSRINVECTVHLFGIWIRSLLLMSCVERNFYLSNHRLKE